MPKSNKSPINKACKIYMDHASSALSTSANPGAIHDLGVKEKNKLENARTGVANMLNAHSNEIIFTSGATESNNLAILGLISGVRINYLRGPRFSGSHPGQTITDSLFLPHIVTTNIEHASVLEVCKHLEKTKQAEVTCVPVEKNGIVDPEKIKKALKPNTILVSVMYANNEIGTVQPIREIAKVIRHFRKQKEGGEGFFRSSDPWVPLPARPFKNLPLLPFFHTDAVQAVNYLPIKVPQLGVDMMSINSVKIYGPKGVGVLYVKKNTPLSPIMFGGGQEFGLRPGTENVALALGLAKALEVTEKIKEDEVKRLTKLREYFFKKLSKIKNRKFVINGDLDNRLPNNINITIPNIPSDLLVIELSARGVMASAKSACKAGNGKASHVIQAINPNTKEEDGSLRFSLGRETTKPDIDYTIKALFQILAKLSKWY